MAELIKTYTQPLAKCRFIGKCYGDEDRVDGGFGKQWGDFFQNGYFKLLEALCGEENALCEDDRAYVGLMRHKEGEAFQYWIGMFLPPESLTPEGFGFVDFETSTLGTGWLKGPEAELYCQEHKVAERLEQEGHKPVSAKDGAQWFFERYTCPRFTGKAEDGTVILDVCFFI